jgi:hypothetical protein
LRSKIDNTIFAHISTGHNRRLSINIVIVFVVFLGFIVLFMTTRV